MEQLFTTTDAGAGKKPRQQELETVWNDVNQIRGNEDEINMSKHN